METRDGYANAAIAFGETFKNQRVMRCLGGRNRVGLVVKILLRREEVDPDKPDGYSQAPLLYAAWRGHEGVVKMLLEREEVNPDKPDNRGQTPFSYAAWGGHEGVVEILLGREDVSPTSRIVSA